MSIAEVTLAYRQVLNLVYELPEDGTDLWTHNSSERPYF